MVYRTNIRRENIMKLKKITAVLILTLAFSQTSLNAQEQTKGDSGVAIGYSADLFPTIISAVDNKAGFAFQTWAGVDNVKIRAIGAHLYQPESSYSSSFEEYETNVTAVIIDRMFSDNFTGFWIGGGIELWNNSIRHKDTGVVREWSDNVLTLGGGYVWKLTDNLYVNPWAAVHYRINDTDVEIAGDSLSRRRVIASGSIKIGYFFNL